MRPLHLFFRLIRWPNLVFILLTQLLFLYCVLHPLLDAAGLSHQMDPFDFFLVATAYLFVAASGYIINDYFDLPIDHINKPDKVFITKGISKRSALSYYVLLNVAALAFSFLSGIRINNYNIFYSILSCELLLFCYSALLKKEFLIGNILVAAVSASAVLVLTFIQGLMEPASAHSSAAYIPVLTVMYTGFAFLISFIREVIKDLEDVEGDRRYGGRTLPILLGATISHYIVAACLVVLLAMLGVVQPKLWQHAPVMAIYTILFIMFPLIFILVKVFSAKGAGDYHQLSTYLKLVMLTGILSMLFFKFISF